MNKKVILPEGKELLCRKLYSDDKPGVLKLFHTAEDYFMLSEGKLPKDADDFFHDLPPGKTASDKILIGLFENDMPLAVADIVRDFPERDTWMTGLLLVHGDKRKQGLGKILHDILVDLAVKGGARIHRIGVLEQNKAALSFWSRLGFEQISVSEPRNYGNIESRVLIMTKNI